MGSLPLEKIPQQWGPDAWMLGVMLFLLVSVVLGAITMFAMTHRNWAKLIERADAKAETAAQRHEESIERRETHFQQSLQIVVEPVRKLCEEMGDHKRTLNEIHQAVKGSR